MGVHNAWTWQAAKYLLLLKKNFPLNIIFVVVVVVVMQGIVSTTFLSLRVAWPL